MFKISIARLAAILLTVFALLNLAQAKTTQLNIYLKFSDKITQQIIDFDGKLQQEGLLTKYHITPFIAEHPVHLTLYLTGFDMSNIDKLKETIHSIANTTSVFTISTTRFSLAASNFLMLDIAKNESLQKLSDRVVEQTMQYRDQNYPIPVWAKNMPQKVNSFKAYGSPNVFTAFDPHFSIFAVSIAKDEQDQFNKDINRFIDHYKFIPVTAQALSIGIGVADANGQITHIIAQYSLSS
ncbi:MAG: 2'-5' RNA ligase family protein [Francisellaceae bacterium]